MQDFASYRNTPNPVAFEAYSTAWTPDVPSIIFGVLIGVFVAFIGLKAAEYRADQAVIVEAPAVVEEVVKKPFVFEFYDELKSYVVLPRG
jgi:ABC-type xylose transport system permease subunit